MSDSKGSKGSGRDQVISADRLCLTFDSNDGPVHALKDVDLTIEKGDFVSLLPRTYVENNNNTST